MLERHRVLVAIACFHMPLADQIELVGVDGRGKGVGLFDNGVNDGTVNFFGIREEEGIDLSAADDHDVVLIGERHDFVKRHHFNVVFNPLARHDDIAAVGQGSAQAFPRFSTHDHGFVERGSFEMLEVSGLTPR